MEYKKLLEKLQSETDTDLSSLATEAQGLVKEEEKDYSRHHQMAGLLGLLQDISERKKYAIYIFIMECVWLLAIIGIIIACGLNWIKISDNVLLALIGSTTVNVTTFFLVVTKYLFPNKGS